MYRLLVVDDEQRERDGIEFLIGKYGLPFHVDKAEHWKCFLRSNTIL